TASAIDRGNDRVDSGGGSIEVEGQDRGEAPQSVAMPPRPVGPSLPAQSSFDYGGRMPNFAQRWLWLLLLLLTPVSPLAAQGPPFQVDDPVPVDLHHYEFYIFGSADGTPVELDSAGPAFEFNWGALPRVQLHAILPWGAVFPAGQPS